MKKYGIILSFVLLAPLVWSSAQAMPLSRLLAGLQAQGNRGLVIDFDRGGIANTTADLFYDTAMRRALAGYQVIVYTQKDGRWAAHDDGSCNGLSLCAAEQLPHLTAMQAHAVRETSALKGAQVLVFRGDTSRPIGLADGFRSLPHALRFVASLHSASPTDPAIHLTAADYAGL